jgi:hypothetical protein
MNPSFDLWHLKLCYVMFVFWSFQKLEPWAGLDNCETYFAFARGVLYTREIDHYLIDATNNQDVPLY